MQVLQQRHGKQTMVDADNLTRPRNFKVFWDWPSNFNLKAWMDKVADSKACSSYKCLQGKVVEVVFRYD